MNATKPAETEGRPLPPLSGSAQQPVPGWWWFVTSRAVALALGLGSLLAIGLLARPLAFLILGVTIATALAPALAWLARWLPRTVAILLLYLFIFAVIGLLGTLILPDLISQIEAFTASLPDLLNVVQRWLTEQDVVDAAELLNALAPQLGNVGWTVVAAPLAITTVLIDLVLILSISVYTLLAGPRIEQFALSLAPPARREALHGLFKEMIEAMGGYARAVIITGFIVGLITYIGLRLIGVNYPLMLSIVAGMLEVIPVLGPIIAGTVITSIALAQSMVMALVVMGFFIVLQQLESNILFPNIMHRQMEISPLLVIFAFTAGSTIGGVLGALVAIPLAAAVQVVVLRVVAPWIRRGTGATTPAADAEQV